MTSASNSFSTSQTTSRSTHTTKNSAPLKFSTSPHSNNSLRSICNRTTTCPMSLNGPFAVLDPFGIRMNMPADRFYIDAPLTGILSLEGAEHHHLAHVMKIRIGEEVEVVNGKGGLATAKVISISKRNAELEVLSATQSPLP